MLTLRQNRCDKSQEMFSFGYVQFMWGIHEANIPPPSSSLIGCCRCLNCLSRSGIPHLFISTQSGENKKKRLSIASWWKRNKYLFGFHPTRRMWILECWLPTFAVYSGHKTSTHKKNSSHFRLNASDRNRNSAYSVQTKWEGNHWCAANWWETTEYYMFPKRSYRATAHKKMGGNLCRLCACVDLSHCWPSTRQFVPTAGIHVDCGYVPKRTELVEFNL